MTDMMKTPSNRRYIVNFQQKEPQNKYDIWLSMNKHFLKNVETRDSEFLLDTDLVFKIYMNGEWRPILGIPLNYEGVIESLKKKINIVKEFKERHLPVFHQGPDECDQLIDGGSIVEMLQDIINNGEIIPINRATINTLGGIKAATINRLNPNDAVIEAKFKGPQITGNNENDKLGVLVSEIYSALTTYLLGTTVYFPIPLMTDTVRGGAKANRISPTPTITLPVFVDRDEKLQVDGSRISEIVQTIITQMDLYTAGEGIEIDDNAVITNKRAYTSERGGVRMGMLTPPENPELAFKPVEAGFMNIENPLSPDYERVFIDAAEVVHSMAEILYTQNWFIEDKGINILPNPLDGTITWRLAGTYDSNNYDKYLKLDAQGNVIWDDLSGVQVYEPLSSHSVPGENYVVMAPQPNSGYLKWDGTFDNPSIGDAVQITPVLLSGTKIATYTINNVTGDLYAPDCVYYEGNGIDITNNYISIDTSGAIRGYVLGYTTNGIEWVPQIDTTYTAGVGIDIRQDNTIDSVITIDGNEYEAITDLHFNCALTSHDHPLGGISIVGDSHTLTILDPYTYAEVILNPNSADLNITFTIQSQPNVMHGDPVYVLLEVAGKPTSITVSATHTEGKDCLINVNNAVIVDNNTSCLDITNYSRFLVTMQFGIVKIEPLSGTVSASNEPPIEEE